MNENNSTELFAYLPVYKTRQSSTGAGPLAIAKGQVLLAERAGRELESLSPLCVPRPFPVMRSLREQAQRPCLRRGGLTGILSVGKGAVIPDCSAHCPLCGNRQLEPRQRNKALPAQSAFRLETPGCCLPGACPLGSSFNRHHQSVGKCR